MVCLKGFVYLARGKGRSWLGFTHDPALDLTILTQEGYETIVSLTPNLPVGIALYVLRELMGEQSGIREKSPVMNETRKSEKETDVNATADMNVSANVSTDADSHAGRELASNGNISLNDRNSVAGDQFLDDNPLRPAESDKQVNVGKEADSAKPKSFFRKLAQGLGWGLLDIPGTEKLTENPRREKSDGWWKWGKGLTSDKEADPELLYWSRRALDVLRKLHELPASLFTGFPVHVYHPSAAGAETISKVEDIRRVAEALEGRLLYMSELEKALIEKSNHDGQPFPMGNLEDLLQLLALVGVVQIFPSVILEGPGQARCVRCGQTSHLVASTCVRCGREKCYYCEECLSMGEARLCRPLYGLAADEAWLERWHSDVYPWLVVAEGGRKEIVARPTRNGERMAGAGQVTAPGRGPVLNFPLTLAQETASHRLLKWAGSTTKEPGAKKGALVWAACGAGKTEVSFATIADVLKKGGRVLFAVPRKDVVLELEPRIQKAFPGVPVAALYGGSYEKYAPSQLVVATTHQAIRFYRSFDLVVLDEVDAFPYQGSAMLYHAVARSRKQNGKIIFMTATPDEALKKETQEKRLAVVTIPARHHGHPLPEPKIVLEKEWRWERDRLVFPEKLLQFLHRSVEGDLAQVFVFVPSVFLAQRVGDALKEVTLLPPFNDFKGAWVEYSHSRDPEREVKRQRFSRQMFPIFVTTSIMERGITVPRANVVVLFAENERIYDDRTLIQMAGRAGRSTERPYGDVWFVGTRVTPAMKEAVRSIRWLNEEALNQGFLYSAEEAK